MTAHDNGGAEPRQDRYPRTRAALTRLDAYDHAQDAWLGLQELADEFATEAHQDDWFDPIIGWERFVELVRRTLADDDGTPCPECGGLGKVRTRCGGKCNCKGEAPCGACSASRAGVR